MLDIGSLMQKAQEMQSKMQEAQEEAMKKSFTVETGGGLITLTVNGTGMAKELKIDSSLVISQDVKMIEDLIVAAINLANKKVETEMKGSVEGLKSLLPNIPGLNF